MAGGNHKNRSNRKQGYLASSEPNSPTIASPGYTITPEKQDMLLKSLLVMMMEDFKNEIQENTSKQLEAMKEKTEKSLRELQENTTKQVKELNKTIQDLKMEVETIKKSHRESTLETEILGKKSGTIEVAISNRMNTRDGRANLRCRRYYRKY
jgi:septal ring factor EnvC (AmiA/AmiB activator)